jgi:hypothetical protein
MNADWGSFIADSVHGSDDVPGSILERKINRENMKMPAFRSLRSIFQLY